MTPFPLSPSCPGEPDWRNQRAALVVAHPGHELLIHGWLEKARPLVLVLTDGSGTRGRPRLDSTARVLQDAGARPGRLFGRFTDAALHSAVFHGEYGRFLSLAEELAEFLGGERIDYVVGDAAEGFDLGHDVCRLLIDAAVARAVRGRPTLRNFELSLENPHIECPSEVVGRSLWVSLDDEAWQRKHAAACGNPDLAVEIDRAAERYGLDALQVECLCPAVPWIATRPRSRSARESWAAHTGRDLSSVRFNEHFLPLAETLRLAAAGSARLAA